MHARGELIGFTVTSRWKSTSKGKPFILPEPLMKYRTMHKC